MTQQIRLWRVQHNAPPVEIAANRIQLEDMLETWLASDISMLDPDLLVIGKQVQTDYGGYIDLLCLDSDGDLVVVELKRQKTPRDITAQVLDYASWVVDLSSERVAEIANAYLKENGPLERAFVDRFSSEPPEALGEAHRLLVVASSVDPSSERIIRYLSGVHGININAATFQFFRDDNGYDILARVFLVEPSQVDQRVISKGGGKRRSKLTLDGAQQLADDIGVGRVYAQAFDLLRGHFDGIRPTGSTISFIGHLRGSRLACLNLLPGESHPERGVRFQAYQKRLAELSGRPEVEVAAALPATKEPWSFSATGDPDWSGWTGYFALEDVTRLVKELFGDGERRANGT